MDNPEQKGGEKKNEEAVNIEEMVAALKQAFVDYGDELPA